MLKKIGPVAMAVAALLATGACSKAADPVNTQAGGTTPSTTAAPGTTAAPDTTKAPNTTKKSTDTSQTHSTGTSKSAAKGFELSADEDQCITDAVTSDPDLQAIFSNADSDNLTAEQAGAAGGLIASCVPKTKIGDSIVGLIKDGPGGSMTSSQSSCVRDQIISLDTTDLGTFIGFLVLADQAGDKSIVAPIVSKLNSACGTNIPA